MAAFYQIVYASTAVNELNREQLMELLKHSVHRNTRAGITGLLLYREGSFMQVLEGEETVVKALYAKITKDPRHHHVITLIEGPIDQRFYPNSSMAFRDLETFDRQNQPGFSEFLNTPLNGEWLARDVPKCQRLLLYFKKNIS